MSSPAFPRPIHKVLIANRGEIALRIMRTVRAMGLQSVAVYSDVDADMPFARYADEAVHIGPATAAESYLIPERIIQAAQATGADAIHPGYGFLSENAAFAQAAEDAGHGLHWSPSLIASKPWATSSLPKRRWQHRTSRSCPAPMAK